jgi:agmatine/peptidylarginine deiminase
MSALNQTLPTYRMPAEWEPHDAVWLQWPDASMRGTRGYARRLLSTWLEMTAILSEHVNVRIAATNAEAAVDVNRFISDPTSVVPGTDMESKGNQKLEDRAD